MALCCRSWFLISLGAGLGWGWDELQAWDGVGMGSAAPACFPEGIPAPGAEAGEPERWEGGDGPARASVLGAAEHSCLENRAVGDFLAFQGSRGGSSRLPVLAEPRPWGLIPKEGLCRRCREFRGLPEGEAPDLVWDWGGWSSVRRSELSKGLELHEIRALQGVGAP